MLDEVRRARANSWRRFAVVLASALLLSLACASSQDDADPAQGQAGSAEAGAASEAGISGRAGAAAAAGEASGGTSNEAGAAGAAGESSLGSAPCRHGGTLVLLANGARVCSCPSGTWGENCEKTTLEVSAGSGYACALKSEGTLACWGRDISLQSRPPRGTFSEVSSSSDHSCGLRSDHTLACWGNDEFGTIDPPSGAFVSVSVGLRHACALKRDGSVSCWGSSDFGEASAQSGPFRSVSAGAYYTCGLKTDGTLACWGGYQHSSPVSVTDFTPPEGKFAAGRDGAIQWLRTANRRLGPMLGRSS